MSFPDPDHLIYDGEYSNSTSYLQGVITEAGNICFGDNPAYTIDDFLLMYPQFGPAGDPAVWVIPEVVLQIFINLASASVQYARWIDAWQVGMGLFVAHWATLWIQSSADAGAGKKAIVGSALNRGITVSKSAGDVSVGYKELSSIESWGSWNLTVFGQQFATMGNLIGMGGMYVW